MQYNTYQEIEDATKPQLLQTMGNVQYLEDLAHEAFQAKNGPLWREVQRFLFNINLRLMKDGYALGTSRSMREWEFRNVIESVEQKHLPHHELPAHITDSDMFLQWLKKDVIPAHRVNHHELFSYFDNDDLSDEELRYILSNYRVNMQRFHLHVAAYSLIVPFKVREELYENLHDEFGEGNFELAHPNLFEPLMDHFGGAKDEDVNPETCHLLNTKINLCWFGDGMLPGMGGMGALELSIPMQQRRMLAHMRRRGLSKELVRFFVVHCECDESHGDGWFAAGQPYISTREDFQVVLDSANRMLDARAGVYDGMLAGVLRRRQAYS